MVVKVYISGISGNKEVKKRQQRVLMILDSKTIKYEIIDITEPGREADKDFMQHNSKSNGGTVSDPNPRSPLPPQVFNDEEYCGDYDQFDLANEVDTLEQFLKVEAPIEQPQETDKINGDLSKSNGNTTLQDDSSVNESKGDQNDEEKLEISEAPPEEPSDDNKEKEPSVEKDPSPDRLKPQETDDLTQNDKSETEDIATTKTFSKENTPLNDVVNENGVQSSREQSKEKEIVGIEQKQENPSEALIQSEQAAAE